MIPTSYTGPAIWRNADNDQPVNILSCLGEKEGLPYFQDDSDSPGGIPGNQLFLPLDPTNRQVMLDHYINRLGWGLCYCEGKNPEIMGTGWQNRPILNVQNFPNGHNIGLNHSYSKTVTLDIDHPAAKIALAAVGIDLDSLLKYRYKIFGNPARPGKPVYRLPAQLDFKPETKQLKWPDPTGAKNENGTPKLITIFELRSGNHQDILPPSIHPDTQQPYAWENIPESPGVLLELPPKLQVLFKNWDSLEPKMKAACPWLDLSPKYDSNFDVAAVQKAFNEKYTPSDILERNGYTKHGDKWLCPNSSTGNPGIISLGQDGNKILSFHGSDPLGDGKPHDAYDCAVILEFNGDKSKAWHTLKDELGITFSQNGEGSHNGIIKMTLEEYEAESLPGIEPLPNDIPYFDRLYTDHFTGLYVDYALKISPMTPPFFHESAALWLASVAIARRLKVPMPFGDVYPNLFILWMAHTTLYRKTTALDIARRITRRIMPHLLMPQDSTPEAMLADLAGREPINLDSFNNTNKEIWKQGRNFAAQKGWTLDEVSSLLAGAGKDYNQGLTEALLRLYDCDEKFSRSTRSQGITIVENAYLSLLGASTPGALSTHINNNRLWSMGFWPRFAILTPEQRPSWQEPQEAEQPAQLDTILQNLLHRLPCPTWPDSPQALTVTLSDGVYQTWQRYNKAVSYDLLTDDLDERLHGTYGRLPTHVIKVAIILAALDWQNESAPVIQSYHLAHAIAICEKWRASTHRALEMARNDESSQVEKRVIKQLGKYGTQGATLRTIHQTMRDKAAGEIESVLQQLVRIGMVEEEETQPGPKGGRKTITYKLV